MDERDGERPSTGGVRDPSRYKGKRRGLASARTQQRDMGFQTAFDYIPGNIKLGKETPKFQSSLAPPLAASNKKRPVDNSVTSFLPKWKVTFSLHHSWPENGLQLPHFSPG